MLKPSLINIDDNILSDKSQLTQPFFSGVKSSDVIEKKRVGIEFEKLPVLKDTYKAAPYTIVAKVLSSFKSKQPQWTDGVFENNALLGLTSDIGTVSLEPGSQTEISLVPADKISDAAKILENYNKISSQTAQEHGVYWLGYGIQPVSTYRNINIIPKKRYEFMTKYLPSVAKKPLVMMRETSGIQSSFDYSSEEDAMKKFSFALKLSPFVSAAFANSPVRNGRLTKYKSNRAASWLDTDNDRCGLVSSKLFSCDRGADFSFDDYAEILLDVPMIFIERVHNNVKTAIKTEKLTFRQFMQHGFNGFTAQKEDWQTHLSLYFPDVRLKSYIEIRNHDNQRSPLICAVPALWKGLIYNDCAMDSVLEMFKGLSYFDFEYIRRKSPQYALDMRFKHLPMKDIVREIVNISYQSLKSYGQNEEKYLEPLKELTDKGITPADVIIGKWRNEWNCDVSKLVDYSRLS